jgi:quercetin dioxygenase-like cupin family protein
MTDRIFPPEALAAFDAAYPEQPLKLGHRLAGSEMFTLDALAALAARLDPVQVEYNAGNLPVGIDPDDVPGNGLSIAETIRGIESCGSWMVLKFVESDPAYRAVMEEALAELLPVVAPRTGAMLKQEAFVFVSSPDAVTPFHFDPEHNVLLQLRGTKTMTVFPAGDEAIVAGASHEAFHLGGHRNLPWQDSFAAAGRAVDLAPGEAVYVPVKAPHWVKNGPDVSISLSITWRSEWSYAESDAHVMNNLLRSLGVEPAQPRRYPARNLAKAYAVRAIRRVQRFGGRSA